MKTRKSSTPTVNLTRKAAKIAAPEPVKAAKPSKGIGTKKSSQNKTTTPLTPAEKRAAMMRQRSNGAARQPDEILPPPPAVTKTPTQSISNPEDARLQRKSKKLKKGKAGKLAKQNGTRALALPMATARNRQIRAEDMIMPRLKLAHGMSQVVQQGALPVGVYYLTGRNQNLGQSVYIVPVDMTMSRSRYTQQEGLLCRSLDMVQGIGNPGIECEGTQEEIDDPEISADERGCMFRLWTEVDGRRVPPQCPTAYNFPVLLLIPDPKTGDFEKGQTFKTILTIRGLSAPAGKQINTAVQNVDQPCWFDNVFELGLMDKQTRFGMTKVMTAKWIGQAPDKILEKAEAYAKIAGAPDFVRANFEADDSE